MQPAHIWGLVSHFSACIFSSKDFLVPRLTSKWEDYCLLAVHNCSFNVFSVDLYIWGPLSFTHDPRMPPARAAEQALHTDTRYDILSYLHFSYFSVSDLISRQPQSVLVQKKSIIVIWQWTSQCVISITMTKSTSNTYLINIDVFDVLLICHCNIIVIFSWILQHLKICTKVSQVKTLNCGKK